MSQTKAIVASELDISQVKYSDVRSLDNGAKIAYVNYGDGIGSIYLQTPLLTFPFDNQYYPDSDNSGKFQCKVSLNTDNPEVKVFVDKLTELDNKVKSDAVKNSQSWFKKKSVSEEVIDEKYTPIIRPYKDPDSGEFTGKYPAQMAFKVTKRNNAFQCSFFDESRNKLNVDDSTNESYVDPATVMSKGNSAHILLQCTGLWFSQVGFGVSWKAVQMLVSVPEKLEEFAFRDVSVSENKMVKDSESDDDDEEDNDDDEENDSESNKVESSEDDSDEEEEEPEPVVVKKKKTRKSSTTK